MKTKGDRDGKMVVAGGFMMLLGLAFAMWSGINRQPTMVFVGLLDTSLGLVMVLTNRTKPG